MASSSTSFPNIVDKKTSPQTLIKDAPISVVGTSDPAKSLVETRSVEVEQNALHCSDPEEQAPFVVPFSPVNLSHKRIRGGLEKSLMEASRCWLEAAEKVDPEQPVQLLYGTHCSAEVLDKISELNSIGHMKFDLDAEANLWIVQVPNDPHEHATFEIGRQMGNFAVQYFRGFYRAGGGAMGSAFKSRCPDIRIGPAHRLNGDPALELNGRAVPSCIIEVEDTHRSYLASRKLGYEYFNSNHALLVPPVPNGFRGVEVFISIKLLAQSFSVVVAMWVRDPANMVSLTHLVSITPSPALHRHTFRTFQQVVAQGLPPIDPNTICQHHQIPGPGNPNNLPDPLTPGAVRLPLPSAQLFVRVSNSAGNAVGLPNGIPAFLDLDISQIAACNVR